MTGHISWIYCCSTQLIFLQKEKKGYLRIFSPKIAKWHEIEKASRGRHCRMVFSCDSWERLMTIGEYLFIHLNKDCFLNVSEEILV